VRRMPIGLFRKAWDTALDAAAGMHLALCSISYRGDVDN
jgi:hypothetical protein